MSVLFARLCGRQFIKAAPSILIVLSVWLYPRNFDFTFKNGSDVRVWSLLSSPCVNGSNDGITPSEHALVHV